MKVYIRNSINEEKIILRQIHDQLVALSRLLESEKLSDETSEELGLDTLYVKVIDAIQDTYR